MLLILQKNNPKNMNDDVDKLKISEKSFKNNQLEYSELSKRCKKSFKKSSKNIWSVKKKAVLLQLQTPKEGGARDKRGERRRGGDKIIEIKKK
jgi:hypothetical protein